MRERPFLKLYYVRIEIVRFDNEFFLSCFPKLILKIPYTLWLGIIAFAAAFVLGLFFGDLLYVQKSCYKRIGGYLYFIFSFDAVYYAVVYFLFWITAAI